MAQRIIGQGDLMGLITKVQEAQQSISQEQLLQEQEKLKKGDFTLEDFRSKFDMMAKMGGVSNLMSHMPGMSDMIPEGEDPEVGMRRIRGMIDSMTREERRNPDLIDMSRRRRIATGSGTEPHEIKQFLNTFDTVRGMMRQFATMSMWDRIKMISGMGKSGMFQPGAMMPKSKIGTGHRKSAKERAEERKKKNKNKRRK
jgi:signal recognition particle subunit SRP54